MANKMNSFKLNKVQSTTKELQEGLEQFYGSGNFYINPLVKYKYTDGVKYFAENAGAYWLLQEINGLTVRLPGYFFNIRVISKDNKADIIIDDGNDNILKKKHIGFTDLPAGEWQFFLTDNVLMLPNEY
jgi:hypothetical protein